jgi:hypothetical protein
MTTVEMIREYVKDNDWATALEIAKHFKEYDENDKRVAITDHETGSFYFLQGTSPEFHSTLQKFSRADDVKVRRDAFAWVILHCERWGSFIDSQGTTVEFLPIVFSLS